MRLTTASSSPTSKKRVPNGATKQLNKLTIVDVSSQQTNDST